MWEQVDGSGWKECVRLCVREVRGGERVSVRGRKSRTQNDWMCGRVDRRKLRRDISKGRERKGKGRIRGKGGGKGRVNECKRERRKKKIHGGWKKISGIVREGGIKDNEGNQCEITKVRKEEGGI